MPKTLIILVALYVVWRLLTSLGRFRRSARRAAEQRDDRGEEYRDLTKQEISDADYEEIPDDERS